MLLCVCPYACCLIPTNNNQQVDIAQQGDQRTSQRGFIPSQHAGDNDIPKVLQLRACPVFILGLLLRGRGVQQAPRDGQTSTSLRFLCSTRIQKYDPLNVLRPQTLHNMECVLMLL